MKDDDYINLAIKISEDNIKVAEADRKRHQLNENFSLLVFNVRNRSAVSSRAIDSSA